MSGLMICLDWDANHFEFHKLVCDVDQCETVVFNSSKLENTKRFLIFANRVKSSAASTENKVMVSLSFGVGLRLNGIWLGVEIFLNQAFARRIWPWVV